MILGISGWAFGQGSSCGGAGAFGLGAAGLYCGFGEGLYTGAFGFGGLYLGGGGLYFGGWGLGLYRGGGGFGLGLYLGFCGFGGGGLYFGFCGFGLGLYCGGAGL